MVTRYRHATLGAVVAFGMLAGCATDWNIERLQSTPRIGHRHHVALMDEYETLALYEGNVRADWTDADYFALKGLAAAAGAEVLPDEVGFRDVPMASVQELTEARAQLVAILYSGGRDFQPERVAQCQALYDCWIEEQEEDHETARIMLCRDGFYECMMAAAGRPAPGPAGSGDNFVILFNFGSAALTIAGRVVVNRAIAAALVDPAMPISVVGFTDTVGDPRYNLLLSEARAKAVRDAMIAAGVAGERITSEAVGESELADETADGVRSEVNRRVVVTIM